MKSRLLFTALSLALVAPTARAGDNQLTAAEKAAGWSLVFDGKSFDGLRVYRQKGPPAMGWEIKDGMMKTVAKVKGADIITDKKYTDFELSWDWRLEPGGNNGVKYCVTEDRPSAPGYEYQMIDDDKHADAKNGPIRQTASFYYVLPAHNRPLKPGGEWNTSRIVIKGNRVEHWLNGKNVLTYELGSAEVKKGVAESKFAKVAGFGDKITGHIMFTYHQDECWYKNVKVRELK
jgi:hypothetical protein